MKIFLSGRDSFVDALEDKALGALIQTALSESHIGIDAPELKHDGLSHYRCLLEVPDGSDTRALVQSFADKLQSRKEDLERSGKTLADLGIYCYPRENEGMLVVQIYDSGKGPKKNLVKPKRYH